MLNYKHIIYILLLLAGLYSCNPAKQAVAFDETMMDRGFFSPIVPNADSIVCYKTNFRTKYIENNYALDYALFSESQMQNAVKYLDASGDSQDIYLLRVYRGNDASAFIYFSAKYSRFPGKGGYPEIKCIGFGPAYYGNYRRDANKITFNKGLKVMKRDGRYYLGYRKGKTVLFIPNQPLAAHAANEIRINKLVLGQRNKIAGKRPVVYPINSLFRLPSLDFKQHTPRNIKMN